MDDIIIRLEKLERQRRDLVIAITILGLALFIFSGVTWKSIPKIVGAALTDSTIQLLEQKALDLVEKTEASKLKAEKFALAAKKEKLKSETITQLIEQERLNAITAVNKIELVESTRISDLESRFSNGVLWGVNSDNKIFWSRDKGKSWNNVKGNLKQITVSDGVLWGVNSKDDIYWSRNEGKSWNKVPGKLKYISAWP